MDTFDSHYKDTIDDFRVDYEDDAILARTIAVMYNASTLVQYSTLALGVFFTITAIVLIAYYLSTLGGGATAIGRRSFDYTSSPETQYETFQWLRILEELEAAFALYGVEAQDSRCWRRLVCEVYLPGTAANTSKIEAAYAISKLIGKLTPDVTGPLRGPDRQMAADLLEAANRGRKKGGCDQYEAGCRQHSLQSIAIKNGSKGATVGIPF